MAQRTAILTMDGGGPHNLLTTILLQRIAHERRGFLEGIDVVAGTSAGSITAVVLGALDNRYDALARSISILEDPQIFQSSKPLVTTLVGLSGTGPFLDNAHAVDYFNDFFGDLRLGDLRLQTIVPALLMDNGASGPARRLEAKLMHNLPPPAPGAAPDIRCADAVLRSTAAPVIMPTYQGYTDGGLFADNPSAGALALVMRLANLQAGSHGLENVIMLSMGTGVNPVYLSVKGPRFDWGYGRWLFDNRVPFALLSSLFEASQDYTDFLCQTFLGQTRYFRLDPLLPKLVPIRGHQKPILEWLEDFAYTVDLAPVLNWIDASGWLAETEPNESTAIPTAVSARPRSNSSRRRSR